jgi:hypothetical protein
MKLQLKFNNQSSNPSCAIKINNIELYRGTVKNEYEFFIESANGPCELLIEHWGKLPEDTIVENGVIVKDKSFELEKVVIDDYDIEELIWESEFVSSDGAVYPSCLFFGPTGSYVLKFYTPVVRWMLETRHNKNNNDPHWEEDYNYWTEACKVLTQISNK